MSYKHITLESTVVKNSCTIKKLYSTYSYFHTQDFTFAGEYHNTWELIYVYSGSVIIETPDYKFTLEKNQAFLHFPNERHKIRANNVCSSLFIFSFDCLCDNIDCITKKPLKVSPAISNYFIVAIEEGLSFLAGKNHIPVKNQPIKYAGGQVVKNTLELALISLIRLNSFSDTNNTPKRIATSNSKIVDIVVDYFKNNIQNKILLEDLTAVSGYSASHLSAIFQKEMGISIKNYFNKMRIDTAKELLSKRTMSIQQVSDYLNFDSVQYFSLRFKKETGLTPSQYAKFLKSQTSYHDV